VIIIVDWAAGFNGKFIGLLAKGTACTQENRRYHAGGHCPRYRSVNTPARAGLAWRRLCSPCQCLGRGRLPTGFYGYGRGTWLAAYSYGLYLSSKCG